MDKLGVAIELIMMLNRYQKLDTRKIRDEMGVSLRTAQRYMQQISMIPMVVYDEATNTCALTEDADLKAFLSSSEISFLTAVLQYAGSSLGANDKDFLDRLRAKILHANSMASVYSMLDPDSIDPQTVVDNRRLLEKAIQDMCKVKFHYRRWNRDYEVIPFRILFHEGFWYLVARHDGIIKKFALDHIESPEVGIHHSDNGDGVEKLLSDSKNVWFRDKKKTKVTVEVDSDVADYFQRKVFFPSQNILKTHTDGSLTVEFEAFNREDMFNLVIRWIPHLIVKKPKRYSDFMKKQLKLAMDKHVD